MLLCRQVSAQSHFNDQHSVRFDGDTELDADPQLLSFTRKLFDIVSDCKNSSIISWARDGNSFEIHDPRALETRVLPMHFKHSRFQSMVRQLNFYAFKKVGKERSSWIYTHECFKRGQPELLRSLKRKTNGGTREAMRAKAQARLQKQRERKDHRMKQRQTRFESSEPLHMRDIEEDDSARDDIDHESPRSSNSVAGFSSLSIVETPVPTECPPPPPRLILCTFFRSCVQCRVHPTPQSPCCRSVSTCLTSLSPTTVSAASLSDPPFQSSYKPNTTESVGFINIANKFLHEVISDRAISLAQLDSWIQLLSSLPCGDDAQAMAATRGHVEVARMQREAVRQQTINFLQSPAQSDVANDLTMYLRVLGVLSPSMRHLFNGNQLRSTMRQTVVEYFLRYSLNLLQDLHTAIFSVDMDGCYESCALGHFDRPGFLLLLQQCALRIVRWVEDCIDQ